MNSKIGTLLRILTFHVLLTQLVGCESETATSRPVLFPVRGTILVDGVPPVGASIKFIHRERGTMEQRACGATVQQDGSFLASTYEQNDGLPPGNYAACLFWLEVPQGGGMMVDRLLGKFMDPSNPIIVFDVSTTAVDLGEIRLKTSAPQ